MRTVSPLCDALRVLRGRAGQPTFREISAMSGLGHATVERTFNGRTLPHQATLKPLVESLGGDEWAVKHMMELWETERTARNDRRVRNSVLRRERVRGAD